MYNEIHFRNYVLKNGSSRDGKQFRPASVQSTLEKLIMEVNADTGQFEPARKGETMTDDLKLHGSERSMTDEEYTESFNAILNSDVNTLLSSLYCAAPPRLVKDMEPLELQAFIHFLDSALKKQKVYLQALKIELSERKETLSASDREELRAKDKTYKVKAVMATEKKSDIQKAMERLSKLGVSLDMLTKSK